MGLEHAEKNDKHWAKEAPKDWAMNANFALVIFKFIFKKAQ